jgi:hypothetical protein
MNSTFNKLRRPALALIAGLGLLALGTAGCTDHGPVGLFSQELFHRNIGLPHLDISSAIGVSQTTTCAFAYRALTGTSGAMEVTVYLQNDGGSSTYGPIEADFSLTDPNTHFVLSNGQTQAMAFAANAPGTEVPTSQTNFLQLLRGYSQSGQDFIVDSTDSFELWYNNPAVPGGCGYPCSCNVAYYPGTDTHPVTIYMLIKDAIGDSWNAQFIVYINT